MVLFYHFEAEFDTENLLSMDINILMRNYDSLKKTNICGRKIVQKFDTMSLIASLLDWHVCKVFTSVTTCSICACASHKYNMCKVCFDDESNA